MQRKRLTSKTLFAESRKDGIFPGDVGNEERDEFYYDVKEFNNEASELKPGWDLPEKYDIEDKRDEMNFGVKKSEVRAFCNARRAIMLAHAILSPKASEAQIEAQSAELMRLRPSTIYALLKFTRAGETIVDKAEDVAEKAEKEVPETVAETVDTSTTVKAEETPAETVEETTETVAEAPAATEETAPAAETTEDVTEIEANEEPELTIEVPEAPATSEAELTITEVEPDPELQAAFGDEEIEVTEDETTEAPAPAVTAKQGVRHLAQPKLTANAQPNQNELDLVWKDLETPANL